MNGETGKFVRLGALLGGAALILGGCVADPFAPPDADRASPIAAQADAAAAARGPMPRFVDIPQIPADIRSAAAFKRAVGKEQAAAAQLKRDTAPGTFSLSGTEAFASQARGLAQAPPSEMPTEADRIDTEAFAKAARGRATPPPSKPQ